VKILLVHWDEEIGRALRRALQGEGHAVMLATDDDTLQERLKRRPDLILIDPELVEVEGRRLFQERSKAPLPLVMPIPAPAEHAQPQPADGEEAQARSIRTYERLATRVMRILRSLVRREATRLKVGELVIHYQEKRVLFHGQPLLLTPLQVTLLGILALHARRVLSPRELMEGVWGYESNDTEARELLKVHVRRLRQKMHAISAEGSEYIQSVRGFGYRLAPPKPR
jgi:DNA-binding response OmpR family regulator